MHDIPIQLMQTVVENNPAPVFQRLEGMGIVPLNRQMTFDNWYKTLNQYGHLSADEAIPIIVNSLDVPTNPIAKHGQYLAQLEHTQGKPAAQMVSEQLWNMVNGTIANNPSQEVVATDDNDFKMVSNPPWVGPVVVFLVFLGFATFVALILKSFQKIFK